MVTLFFGFSKRRAEIIALSDDKSSPLQVLQDTARCSGQDDRGPPPA